MSLLNNSVTINDGNVTKTKIKSENKAWVLAMIQLKRKLRNWQNIFYSIGFPLLFIFIFYFIYGMYPIPHTPYTIYDFGYPGMIVYATGGLIFGSSIFFANDKKTGMLDRMDTLPMERKNLFLGYLIADSLYGSIQICILFVIGYGFMDVYFANPISLFIGFNIALLFGLQSIGLGIIIASIAKSGESANGLSMMYYMPVIFASGSLIPFESPIVYFMPPYWAKQIYLQLTVMNHSLVDPMYSSSLIGSTATTIGIPLWGGLLFFIGSTVILLVLGIVLFQKKTQF
jgi:ABC-2 type transport system permease protein